MSGNFLRRTGAGELQLEAVFQGGLVQQIQQRFPAVERRKSLSADELRTQYRENQRPVIVEGGLCSWRAVGNWTFDSLAAECGELPVVIDHYSPERTTKTTFADFVAKVKSNTGPDAHPLYLQEWHFLAARPSLSHDVGPLEIASYDYLPKLYGSDFVVRALWVGQRGAVTRLHQDHGFTDTIHGQIHGRKQWCLFAPDTVLPTTSDDKPDASALLADPKADLLHCTLAPGDVLYLPAQWWHRVSLVDDSIGIGMPTLDERNLFLHMKSRLQELLPLILNPEQIKQNHLELYQITMARLAVQAKRFGIDLTRIR